MSTFMGVFLLLLATMHVAMAYSAWRHGLGRFEQTSLCISVASALMAFAADCLARAGI